MKTTSVKAYNKPFLFLLFLSLSAIGLAQNNKLDSLQTQLKAHPEKDTARVELLNDISFAYYGFDHDQLKKFAEEANVLAREIGFINGEARSWYLKGLYHLVVGEFDSSLTNLDRSLALHEKKGNKSAIAGCYGVMALVYQSQEQYDDAILFHNKALQLAKDENDIKGVATSLTNIGRLYTNKGEFEDAEIKLKQSIALYEILNDKEGAFGPLSNLALVYTQQNRHTEALKCSQECLANYRKTGNKLHGAAVLLNMSLIYSSLDQNDKAIPYLLEGLELTKELNDEIRTSYYMVAIGYVHYFNKEYDQALKYYNEALAICEKVNHNLGLYNCYSNIGRLYIDKEDYELALVNYKKGLEVSLASSHKVGMAGAYTELGVIYFELGDYKNAREHSLKGKEIADELSLVITQAEASRVLSELSEKENDFEEALERFKDYKMYSDSLFNKEQVEKITSLEFEFKYQQELDSAKYREQTLTKSIESTSLQLKKSETKYLYSIIIFLIISILLGAIIVYLRFRNIKSKTHSIVMEQKLLRSQMTPHFIFNSLSILQGMILNKEDKKSITYLSKFSKLLRSMLENSREKTVSLAQELSAVENYLALQILQDNTYKYHVNVDDGIDVTLFEIPAMLIQPFAENAFEHAFPSRVENQLIVIHVSFVNNKLICTITDNGVGINSQKQPLQKNKKSLATTITSERLKILSKDFKIHGAVTIEDRQKYNEQGTVVTLEIPYKLFNR